MEENNKDFSLFMIMREMERLKQEIQLQTTKQINGIVQEFRDILTRQQSEIDRAFKDIRSATNHTAGYAQNSELFHLRSSVTRLQNTHPTIYTDIYKIKNSLEDKIESSIRDSHKSIASLSEALQRKFERDSVMRTVYRIISHQDGSIEKVKIDNISPFDRRIKSILKKNGYTYIQDVAKVFYCGREHTIKGLGPSSWKKLKPYFTF